MLERKADARRAASLSAKAHACAATSVELEPKERAPNEPAILSTSATGARSRFTPTASSARPAASPSERASVSRVHETARGESRRRPEQTPDGPALLIGHDQQRGIVALTGGLLQSLDQFPRRYLAAGHVVAEQDYSADLSRSDAREERGRGGCPGKRATIIWPSICATVDEALVCWAPCRGDVVLVAPVGVVAPAALDALVWCVLSIDCCDLGWRCWLIVSIESCVGVRLDGPVATNTTAPTTPAKSTSANSTRSGRRDAPARIGELAYGRI